MEKTGTLMGHVRSLLSRWMKDEMEEDEYKEACECNLKKRMRDEHHQSRDSHLGAF